MRTCMVLLALFPAIGCGDRREPVRPDQPPERRWVALDADTLWKRGGLADTVLEIPYAMTADERHVYLTDLGSRRVAALRVEDGTTVWTAGGPGRGPGEFERPAAMTLQGADRLAVSDTRLGRLVFLGRDGAYRTTFPVEDPEMNALCGLADGSVVASAVLGGPPVTRWSEQGRLISRSELPWPELAGASSLARQTLMAPLAGRDGCIVALALGRGFARFDGDRFGPLVDYIEPVGIPQVEEREWQEGDAVTRTKRLIDPVAATRSLAAVPGRVIITFDGATELRGRILDVYTEGGEYLHSYRLERTVHGLAWAEDRLFILSRSNDVPMLIALHWPASATASAAGAERTP